MASGKNSYLINSLRDRKIHTEMVIHHVQNKIWANTWPPTFDTDYSLADIGYSVHPAANANLIAYIWRVAELMHYSNVIGIGPLEELTLQRY